eukprot:3940764-Rhodomonas_salina.2
MQLSVSSARSGTDSVYADMRPVLILCMLLWRRRVRDGEINGVLRAPRRPVLPRTLGSGSRV